MAVARKKIVVLPWGTMPAVEVHRLSKTFRFHHKEPGLRGSLRSLFHRETLERLAVDAVSFCIEQGEIVGFLGPNGAGKTTTLKMLCGLLLPTSGSARVLGYTPFRRDAAFLESIALVMGQKTMLTWDIPAMETFLLQREMYGMSGPAFRASLEELATMLDVTHLLRVQVRKLSLGERMKMELLAALLHRPQVLFLDEPTIGLDVLSQQRVRDFLRDLNRERRTTILLTSHYMDDIEALCRRVMVIDEGRLHFDGELAALVERLAPMKQVQAVYAEEVLPQRVYAELEGLAVQLDDDLRRISVAVPRVRVAHVAAQLLQMGAAIDLTVEEAPVEEIVRELFREQRTSAVKA
jgi:ABC-2 type transport system ATP-binding protein